MPLAPRHLTALHFILWSCALPPCAAGHAVHARTPRASLPPIPTRCPPAQNAQGAEIIAKQEASAESRKSLMEAAKAFRKLPDEERGAASLGVLKVFQDEVDALTRRSK